ncbi:MAG: acyltransferase [Candidatus Caldarchaeum sp.]|nr:acyltransferase [Candidatus Caldarchaeum sp.]
MARTLKVGLIQMNAVEEKGKNIEKAINLIGEAAEKGAKIVCLQELFFSLYFCAQQKIDYFSLAEPIPGPSTLKLAEVAKKYGVTIVAPVFEEDTTVPGTYYNTAAVINHNGEIIGKYRKIHIPQLVGYNEKFYFKPGNLGYPVFQDNSVKFGVIICYDRHFPEGPRILALKGAEIVFVPTCTGYYPEMWETELAAHAAFNTIYVCGVNRVGKEFPDQPAPYYGKSCIFNPRGERIASAPSEEHVLVSELDLDLTRERRKYAPFLRDRVPELYGELVQKI